MKTISGSLDGTKKKVAIVVSRFNESVTGRLLSGAEDCLVRHGVSTENITAVRVPGAFEIPQMVRKIAKTKKYDGIVTLGCVIKGETAHNDYVSSVAVQGVHAVAMESGIPITLGILTTETVEQAEARSGSKQGNKGRDAAESLIEMMNALDLIQ